MARAMAEQVIVPRQIDFDGGGHAGPPRRLVPDQIEAAENRGRSCLPDVFQASQVKADYARQTRPSLYSPHQSFARTHGIRGPGHALQQCGG